VGVVRRWTLKGRGGFSSRERELYVCVYFVGGPSIMYKDD